MILTAAIISGLVFTGCSTDDSDDDNGQDCRLCTIEIEFGGVTESSETEVCDNGDGTITVVSEEATETVNLEEQGITFEEFIEAFALLGTCEAI